MLSTHAAIIVLEIFPFSLSLQQARLSRHIVFESGRRHKKKLSNGKNVVKRRLFAVHLQQFIAQDFAYVYTHFIMMLKTRRKLEFLSWKVGQGYVKIVRAPFRGKWIKMSIMCELCLLSISC